MPGSSVLLFGSGCNPLLAAGAIPIIQKYPIAKPKFWSGQIFETQSIGKLN